MKEEKKTMFLIEQVPGFDMRLKMHGDATDLIQMLQGAMVVEPRLVAIFQCAIDLLPEFKECVDTKISLDFNGNIQQ